MLGRKLYILGVAGYNRPIWDVLALQGVREEAGERLWGDRLHLFFPIRQAVPVGLARVHFCSWAHWACFFIVQNIYILLGTVHLHIIYHFICIWAGNNGWMALDEFG